MKRCHEPPVLLYFLVFLADLLDSLFRFFVSIIKIHFPLANANNRAKLKGKHGLKMTVFAHSQTTNKLVNEAANDSARVSGQDRKIPPSLGTNQIAGFGGFRPFASLEINNTDFYFAFTQKQLKSLGGLGMRFRLSEACI